MLLKAIEKKAEFRPDGADGSAVHLAFPELRVTWLRSHCDKKELFIDAGVYRLFFCLDGMLQAEGFVREPRHLLQIHSGYCGFIFHPLGCTCHARGHSRSVAIDFTQSNFLQFLGEENLSRAIWLARKKKQALGVVIPTPPPMKRLLKLMELRANGQGAGRFFVAAKAVELMGLFAEHFSHTPRLRIPDADRHAVFRAQVFLEKRMADPPSLHQLASHVGMSLSKLKQLFPDVCGLPPYGYLRQARMERAFGLLQTTDMSVTEVALEVGYNSPSRFSKAFFTRFGFNPSDARKTFYTSG